MNDRKAELGALLGKENVMDDPDTLESYSRDQSFSRVMKPSFVLKLQQAEHVQEVVKWANRTATALVPVSSGPPHFHGDTVPGVPGAVVVDLSGMKKIININRRNRIALVEPGVTYGELQPALAKEGMRVSVPLLPRANKSVITSLLEREPRINSRYQWSSMDPLRCLEIVWGDGNVFRTGDASFDTRDLEELWPQQKWQVTPVGPGQTDFYRLLSAAQGSMGFATWASLRCEILPSVHKLFFLPAQKLDSLLDFTYRILRFRYADELFILNGANLAYLLGEDSAQIKALMEQLPPWTVLLGIAGRAELPEERVEFQQKDIGEIAHQFGLELKSDIPGASGPEVLKLLTGLSQEPYWKLRYKGGCHDIFFVTTLDRTPEFVNVMQVVAEGAGYPVPDVGVYIQPRHQGVNCHCELNLPYRSDSEEETSRMRSLLTRGSEGMLNNGAFFSRPYNIWANMAFERDVKSTGLLRKIKSTFDPRGVMNPGKLCFEVKQTEE
jgi:hypothetical protein